MCGCDSCQYNVCFIVIVIIPIPYLPDYTSVSICVYSLTDCACSSVPHCYSDRSLTCSRKEDIPSHLPHLPAMPLCTHASLLPLPPSMSGGPGGLDSDIFGRHLSLSLSLTFSGKMTMTLLPPFPSILTAFGRRQDETCLAYPKGCHPVK